MPNGDQISPAQVLSGQAPPALAAQQPPTLPVQPPQQAMVATPQPPQLPQQTPQQIAAAAAEAHHSLIGKAAKFLMGMPTIDASGQAVPQRPGQVFRSLLMGALIGGELGSQPASPGAPGFLVGAGKGASAVEQQNYERQQAAQKQQMEQKRLDLDQQRTDAELMVHRATAAHLAAETLQFHTLQAQHDQDVIDKKNEASRAYVHSLDEVGALPVRIPINGVTPATNDYNAQELVQAYMKDRSILQAPAGMIRHFVDVQDAKDVTYSEGKGWVDDAGQPVDMSKVSNVKIYDIPQNLMNKYFEEDGDNINKVVGYNLIPDDQIHNKFMITPAQITTLYTNHLKDLNIQAQQHERENRGKAAVERAAGGKGGKRGTPVQFSNLDKDKFNQINDADKQYRKDLDDPNVLDAEAKRDQRKAEIQKSYEARVRDLGGWVDPKTGKSELAPQQPAGQAAPAGAAPAPGGQAPEGTRIRVGNQIQEKRGGKWVVVVEGR